jgi:hypothetical protein
MGTITKAKKSKKRYDIDLTIVVPKGTLSSVFGVVRDRLIPHDNVIDVPDSAEPSDAQLMRNVLDLAKQVQEAAAQSDDDDDGGGEVPDLPSPREAASTHPPFSPEDGKEAAIQLRKLLWGARNADQMVRNRAVDMWLAENPAARMNTSQAIYAVCMATDINGGTRWPNTELLRKLWPRVENPDHALATRYSPTWDPTSV